jgi:hypothetical protein
MIKKISNSLQQGVSKHISIILLALVGLFLLFGFGMSLLVQIETCTERACSCPFEDLENSSYLEKEVPCNSCTRENYLFFTLILNVGLESDGREYIKCEGSTIEELASNSTSEIRYEDPKPFIEIMGEKIK